MSKIRVKDRLVFEGNIFEGTLGCHGNIGTISETYYFLKVIPWILSLNVKISVNSSRLLITSFTAILPNCLRNVYCRH